MRAVLITLLAVHASGAFLRAHQKPFTGCKKVSLLHRGDPADAKTIEGDDCGNVKQIVGKWAKSKKVGGLAGAAKAAVMGADLAAKNANDASSQAKDIGKKVGLNDEMPQSVKLSTEEADKKSKAATKAGSTLKATADTFKGKFGNFAKDISDADISKIQEETQAAIDAADDAKEAGDRALAMAAEAKDDAMKSVKGALKLLEATLLESNKLSKDVEVAVHKSEHAVGSVGDLIKKTQAAEKKIDAKAKDAKEQKPVWEAYKHDLEGREKAADQAAKDVTDHIKKLNKSKGDMDSKTKTLQGVKDAGQSAPNVLLGQAKNIDAATAAIRKTEREFAQLKLKVQTMMKDSERLAEKLDDTNKKLK